MRLPKYTRGEDGLYRLVCQGCGAESPPASDRLEGVSGAIWHCSSVNCSRAHLARQRALAKLALTERGIDDAVAENRVASSRWDIMPDNRIVGTPDPETIAAAETEARDETQRGEKSEAPRGAI